MGTWSTSRACGRDRVVGSVGDDPGAGAALGDLGDGYALVLGEQLHAPPGAEPALAAPHAGTGAELESVQGVGAAVQRVTDLRFGDDLAAADQLGVAGVGPRERLLLLGGQVGELDRM